MSKEGITIVSGIEVGHYTDSDAATGCTVVICRPGAVGGVDVRGSAPGTRETDLLRPTTLVTDAHAVLLSGGSAFGLDAASGVMRYLEERGIGYPAGSAVVPIVPAGVLFDLAVGNSTVRPGPDEGYRACTQASSGSVAEGSVGAGTGATVGKVLGMDRAVKGGIGTASLDLGDGLAVGALVAVNASGGVFEPETGRLVAGPRSEDGTDILDPVALITAPGFEATRGVPTNTTVGVVATNARLSKEQANKLASVAHDGLAMSIRPAHTMVDGDTMFALATGKLDGPTDMNRLCTAVAVSVARAVVRGVRLATSLAGIPAAAELSR